MRLKLSFYTMETNYGYLLLLFQIKMLYLEYILLDILLYNSTYRKGVTLTAICNISRSNILADFLLLIRKPDGKVDTNDLFLPPNRYSWSWPYHIETK